MEVKTVIAKLSALERKILPLVDGLVSFKDLVSKSGLQEVEVMRALQWLQIKKLLF